VLDLRSMTDVDRELDRLFGLPLGEFTRARNDLAKRLKANKEDEAAEEIRALPKPTVPAWTVNQLSRVDRAGIRALLEAGKALGGAQQRLLRGDDAGAALRDATVRERQAVEHLTERARAVLEDADRPATAAVLDRIGTTLRAAAVTDDGRALLETGRLTTELEPPGFDAFAPVEGRAARRPKPKPARGHDELAERRRRREERQLRRRELQEKARIAERAARDAEREAGRAEEKAAKARRVAEQARAEADAAAAALAET
jgi:hypothetical protein